MQALLEHLPPKSVVGFTRAGQSNERPWGHRNKEGFVAAPHLKLGPAGQDLTILSLVGAAAKVHGAIGTKTIVNVADSLVGNYWINGELRLVQHEHGDDVTSSLRRGHAKVTHNAGGAVGAPTFEDDGGELVVVWPGHGRANGCEVNFDTAGSLPAGITAGERYFVRDASRTRFKVSLDPWGTAVAYGANTGAHASVGKPYLTVEWVSAFQVPDTNVDFANTNPGFVQSLGHTKTAGSTVSFTETSPGDLPPELTAGQSYYVLLPVANGYLVSATRNGLPLAFTTTGGAVGTASVVGEMLSYVSGYVHLHDRFNSYDSVQVVTPYQPIEPGDYPDGVPSVPGVTLADDVTSYEDCALVLPFAWNEGIEGHGKAGSGTLAGNTFTLDAETLAALGDMVEEVYVDGYVRVGAAKGRVQSNGDTSFVVKDWKPGKPADGTYPFELHLPHWRNNPHHDSAGEGFLYPSNDMQPGGASSLSQGMIYSRPRARLTGSYVGVLREFAPADPTVNADQNLAQLKTASAGDLTASIPAPGVLRLQRSNSSRSVATGLIQFEDFLRPGNVALVLGTGITGVDGNWRVQAMGQHYGGAGSFVDLVQLSESDQVVPASVSGTINADATVSRLFTDPQHRMGSLLELAYRTATATGRTIVVTHLGINSSGQFPATINNAFGFQGKIGWRDDDNSLDWSPSNPDGNAARLQRLIEFIAPRAVQAKFGADAQLYQLFIDMWQLEADAITKLGRQLAPRTIPTFANWLRDVITRAGQSPYSKRAKIPFQWAILPTVPWESTANFYGQIFAGDVDGEVNAALADWRARDGFAVSVDTNDSPQLDGSTFFGNDPLHFNGFGGVKNAELAAGLLLPMVEFALSFGIGKEAVVLCNQALSLIGEEPTLTSLSPPDETKEAERCVEVFPEALAVVLQMHAWSFATERTDSTRPLLEVENRASTWAHAYAVPPELLNPVAVIAPDANDDLQVTTLQIPGMVVRPQVIVQNATQPFRIEVEDGHRVLRTNQPDAVLIYTVRNVHLSLWDPLVRQALVWQIAHLLAGGVIKGREGTKIAQQLAAIGQARVVQGAEQNAGNHVDMRPKVVCDWLPPEGQL